MKVSIRCAVTLALCCCFSGLAHAQSGTQMAVIDVSKIFKNHTRFKQAMEGMKAEVKAFEATLQERGKQINDLKKQMQPFEPGSPEYKQLEAQIMKIQADGQIEATQKRKDFLAREARIYHDVYNEVTADVARFAEQHGIQLVVRFNSDQIDPKDRNSVLEGVNRAVVYQSKLNITNNILQRLEQKRVAQNPAATQAAAGTPAARR